MLDEIVLDFNQIGVFVESLLPNARKVSFRNCNLLKFSILGGLPPKVERLRLSGNNLVRFGCVSAGTLQ